ncbi:MAG: hypothetical protein LC732_03895, partial [Acidobacteria bacterium]|nr:hypothetical protein [Acidobacteriota bacterium]
VDIRSGHRVRLVAFGNAREEMGAYLKILHSEVVAYIDRYLRENWELVRQAGSKDPVLGMMVLLAKARGIDPEANAAGPAPPRGSENR